MADLAQMKGSVIVVDDLHTNREIMSRILARNGYAVMTAESGTDALALIRDTLPDLVLLDVNMPEMNGFEVCEQIKSDEVTEHIPVIFISALSELGDKVRAFEAGAVDYIIKPFKVEEVLARVNSQMTLAHQRQQILALNEVKDQLLRTVSHDLKNPIHIIMGYAALLMEPQGMNETQVIEMATQIFRSAEKMFKLVTNLLDLTQIEAGLKFDYRRVPLKSLIYDVMNEFELTAQQKDIELTFALPPGEVALYVDPMRIQQVLSNLVSNALKYTLSGSWVRLEADVVDGYVHISVMDGGLGIPPSDLPNLFEKFFRVNTVEHKEQEGTGLGLSIVKAIVEEHGGTISVQSEVRRGSVFTVHLPLG